MNIKEKEWYKRAKEEAEKPIQTNERVSSVGFFVLSLLFITYLLYLQIDNSNFYTDDYGYIEMFAQYGFWAMWMTTAFLEGILGKRFASRAFDIFGGILFATVASLWLAVVFPYNFDYFTELMPDLLAKLFSWISNDVGRVIISLSFLFHLVALIISPIAYKFIDMDEIEGGFRKVALK